ncbi:hypothetical protein DFJ74DRAFT_64764 [Hyaloraphidium curvatum]|nr:hypothetical protein DFJ74DRAFT_64764 [Hyaloraphidium curvatum]
MGRVQNSVLLLLGLCACFAGIHAAAVGQWSSERRLIQLAEDRQAEWMAEEQIFALIRQGTPFMDVTDSAAFRGESLPPAPLSSVAIPEAPAHQDLVKGLISKISTSGMKEFLKTFTAFNTRFYKSPTGEQSAKYLLQNLQEIAAARTKPDLVDVQVTPFRHAAFNQPSIIVRISAKQNATALRRRAPQEPIQPDEDEVVIVGCHQDSVNGWFPWGRAPGADDNGSGTAAVREVLRILMSEGFVPKHPIELHFNAAEEGGLLGSQAISEAYRKENRRVIGYLQQDMNGYLGATGGERREVLGIGTDFVDPELSAFLRKLVEEYNQIKAVDTKCGYGCSDHASWNKAGYRAAFPFEAPFEQHNPHIHTADDTIEYLSFKHIAQFVELILAFVVELSYAPSA